MARGSHKHPFIQNVLEFVKLQLAGNILFFGGLIGVALAEEVLHIQPMLGLIGGSIIAHIIFFFVNKNWIFHTSSKGHYREIVRFVIFMSFNFVLNILLVSVLTSLILHHVPAAEGFEYYLGVVTAAIFFAIWSYVGLKFWVFTPTKRHAALSRHHGLTYEHRKRRA